MKSLEIHVIQNFSPSCLNRDDTNAPKDCVFGGFRRARISSQCIKRSVRQYFKSSALLPREDLAVRTMRVVDRVADALVDKGRDRDAARGVVGRALAGLGFSMKKGKGDEATWETEYLLFLSETEVQRLTAVCDEHWDTLAAIADQPVADGEAEGGNVKKKDKKKGGKAAIPDSIKSALAAAIGGPAAVDLALFGRMLADDATRNVDAACQVAHALSTNEVAMEMDYFTAVDDLKPEGEQGAGMLGVVEFNSSCFYRYAVVDLDALKTNLGGDGGKARQAAMAFLQAFVHAIPTGRQNSMAAHNPPSYVRAIVRDGGQPWNLANAFSRPIRPRRNVVEDLAEASVGALDGHLSALEGMYGDNGRLLDVASGVVGTGVVPLKTLVTRIEEALG